LTRAR